jgi:hypothetical protein
MPLINEALIQKILKHSYTKLEEEHKQRALNNLRHVPTEVTFKANKKLRKLFLTMSDSQLMELYLIIMLGRKNPTSNIEKTYNDLVTLEKRYYERNQKITYLLSLETLHDELVEGLVFFKQIST